jgi:uncharacterized protein with PIN domain
LERLCPVCELKGLDELTKYRWKYAKGKIRPILVEVTLSILKCPKCKRVYYNNKKFFLEALQWERLISTS